jgi:hypothetical protein
VGIGAGPGRQSDDWSQATVEDLLADLADAGVPLAHGDVLDVVQGCRRDLAGVQSAALPELTYRLARQRLESLAATATPTAAAQAGLQNGDPLGTPSP